MKAISWMAGCAWLLSAACHPLASGLTWTVSPQPLEREPEPHPDVHTLNRGYERVHSQVLVREVTQPTRAALDYAAYHANFMIADAAPEPLPAARGEVRLEQPFAGLIERATLTADITQTPLGAAPRARPLAFAPLSEYLLAHKAHGAAAFEELGSAVRAESWGQPPLPGVPTQTLSEVYLHALPSGGVELWVKVEFAPWFTAFKVPDQDRDGYPELYGRARSDRLTPELLALIESDYASRKLSAAEIRAWANQLASYWYPSFNTDLVQGSEHSGRWPDDHTEAAITRELAGLTLVPSVVLRGKPAGTPVYNVFVIQGMQPSAASAGSAPRALARTLPSPAPASLAERIRAELARAGGTWQAWADKLAGFQAAVRARLKAASPRVKALAGSNGFLFYRNSLEFVVGGDLEQQPPGKNPLPIIVAWKRELERLGVDFLFVPVPSKIEIYPDAFDPHFKALVGELVNPHLRKLELSLAEQGVEVLDLHTPFLAARSEPETPDLEPLYQHQDTHWSARGLELAARLLAARVKTYPWYAELAQHAQPLGTQDVRFTRYGDLHSRLPEAQQKRYAPESLIAHTLLRADGTAYEADPESPIVLLGDSFTGVYELTDAEHAGLAGHLARGVAYPIDLVMSYGGGPNVRSKLLRRGEAALAQKKLVIWVMADRDLYNYWEDWQPIHVDK